MTADLIQVGTVLFAMLAALTVALVAAARQDWPTAFGFLGSAITILVGLVVILALRYWRARRKPAPPAVTTVQATEPQPMVSLPNEEVVPVTIEDLQIRLEAERIRARHWEYMYLNGYFVPHTQETLDWLIGLGKPTTLALYDDLWKVPIPHVNWRVAIIQALTNNFLIVLRDGLLTVTPKGHDYAEWRGPYQRPDDGSPPPAAVDDGGQEGA